MKNFTARTESGTIYTAKDGILEVQTPHGQITVMKPVHLRAVDRDAEYRSIPELVNGRFAEDVDVPKVGLSIYASAIDMWRLSTPVVEVVA